MAAAAVVATLVLIVGILVVTQSGDDDGVVVGSIGGASAPAGFGEWTVLHDAPISPRFHAVSAWTGSEAVFWAGTNASRSHAYTDGAAYDPVSGTWERLAVPGWGHPGLSAAFFDGQLLAVAKGNGSRYDLATGVAEEMAPLPSLFVTAMVASADEVWGVGPASVFRDGRPELVIVAYNPVSDSWGDRVSYRGDASFGAVVQGLAALETEVVWSGSEVVVWGGGDGAVAFDPVRATWRELPRLVDGSGSAADGPVAASAVGLVAVVQSEVADESALDVVVLDGDGWRPVAVAIAEGDVDDVAVAAAGEWIAVLSPESAPVTVHVPSGAWSQHDVATTASAFPNTVWTGTELIVWAARPATSDEHEGFVWTPPAPIAADAGPAVSTTPRDESGPFSGDVEIADSGGGEVALDGVTVAVRARESNGDVCLSIAYPDSSTSESCTETAVIRSGLMYLAQTSGGQTTVVGIVPDDVDHIDIDGTTIRPVGNIWVYATEAGADVAFTVVGGDPSRIATQAPLPTPTPLLPSTTIESGDG